MPSILHLVLYSNDPAYNKMYEMTRKYYSTFDNVTTLYYTFDENLLENAKQIGDILYIRGKDTFIPGILEKTVAAMEYGMKNYSFDYLVRSNISTIVDMDRITSFLEKTDLEYGGVRFSMDSLQPHYGITDNKYFGTDYASGICILLSKRCVSELLYAKDDLDMTVIDDVAIGILINQLDIPAIYVEDYWFIPSNISSIERRSMIYRNHNGDREKDIKNMKVIIDELSR
jgi:hypothetical protein